MTNAQMWALIVGFASPMLISVINRPEWSQAARTLVQVVVSVLVGLGSALFAGDFAGKDVVTSILVAAVAAISAYKGVFKPAGIAPKVEKATSPAARG
ncbi:MULTISPECIES: hypothetical protein [Streptomyces]|uniref:Holin n=2 Tax=Streptomyces rimosus subsp. rimosus TaxID=132474 RepID=L8EL25_STRR1|nr:MULTISPECIES: hypothetical protein [Streptomyces]KOG69248.1 hypothetical protein ADK78_34295 [Kitasatospora aureofaciens]MYT40837.1 hypothetical protein [Streptomyces sp. SID5471]KEF06868.1 hypothetical protein DF17_11160 [Streptomyces rimosus]KEF22244.1 hypothetical protein DF18_02670 [Streptomyces rimosus]KOT27320.1 hypothetical protein ADK42_36220 [Streptomyces rimosus subsp. rimosus]